MRHHRRRRGGRCRVLLLRRRRRRRHAPDHHHSGRRRRHDRHRHHHGVQLRSGVTALARRTPMEGSAHPRVAGTLHQMLRRPRRSQSVGSATLSTTGGETHVVRHLRRRSDPRIPSRRDRRRRPVPVLVRGRRRARLNPTLVRTESCDLCVIGGGYTGLWTAIIAKERDPWRDVVLIDAHEIGSPASGRNGGFMEASLTHGVANGQERFPDELPLLEELGLKNLNDIEAAIKPLQDRLRLRAHRRDRRGHRTTRRATSTSCARTTRSCANWASRSSGSTGDAMQAQVNSPTYLGGCGARTAPRSSTRPARLGPEGGGRVAGRAHLRGHQGDEHRDGRRRRAGHHAARARPRRQGGAGHQRVQAVAQAHRPLHRPGLRLLHGHRAAVERAAGVDRVEAPPGPVRHRQPVPLLPAHRGQPDPVGRLRRHLLLRRQGQPELESPPRDLGQAAASTSSTRSRSSRA